MCFSERNGPITLMELILLESNYVYCVYYVYSVDNIIFLTRLEDYTCRSGFNFNTQRKEGVTQ